MPAELALIRCREEMIPYPRGAQARLSSWCVTENWNLTSSHKFRIQRFVPAVAKIVATYPRFGDRVVMIHVFQTREIFLLSYLTFGKGFYR